MARFRVFSTFRGAPANRPASETPNRYYRSCNNDEPAKDINSYGNHCSVPHSGFQRSRAPNRIGSARNLPGRNRCDTAAVACLQRRNLLFLPGTAVLAMAHGEKQFSGESRTVVRLKQSESRGSDL